MLFVCVLVGGVALENMCGYGIMCGETATGDLRVPRHVCPFFLCFFFFFVCALLWSKRSRIMLVLCSRWWQCTEEHVWL